MNEKNVTEDISSFTDSASLQKSLSDDSHHNHRESQS